MAKLTDDDRAAYAAAMRAIGPLDDDEVEAGLVLSRVRALPRGEHLLRAGARYLDCFFGVVLASGDPPSCVCAVGGNPRPPPRSVVCPK